MKKEYIIPIFVPNLGCPNCCVFCNQKKISGEQRQVTKEDVKETIEYYLQHFKDDNKYVEVAFFGGSFTGIDENIQNSLLEAVQRSVKFWEDYGPIVKDGFTFEPNGYTETVNSGDGAGNVSSAV